MDLSVACAVSVLLVLFAIVLDVTFLSLTDACHIELTNTEN